MADVIHDRLLNGVDWNPTYINSLTASTPACIRTPIHFSNDREALSNIAPTVGKTDLSTVTYCRIRNTLELIHLAISENLVPMLHPNIKVVSEPFELPFNAAGDFGEFQVPAELPEDAGDFEEATHSGATPEIVRG
jgi:hypothetical protein